jgi:hypothetical protein
MLGSKPKRVASATVLLKSASGKAVSDSSVITSETIHEYRPAPNVVASAQKGFQSLGFETGPLIGISFSITAPIQTFERIFRVKLGQTKQGGLQATSPSGKVSERLPTQMLPGSLQAIVTAITFVAPPEFGPSEFTR